MRSAFKNTESQFFRLFAVFIVSAVILLWTLFTDITPVKTGLLIFMSILSLYFLMSTFKFFKNLESKLYRSSIDRQKLEEVILDTTDTFIFDINIDTMMVTDVNKRAKLFTGEILVCQPIALRELIYLTNDMSQELINKSEVCIETYFIDAPEVKLEIFRAGKSVYETNRMFVFAKDVSREALLFSRQKTLAEIIDLSVNEVHIFSVSDYKYTFMNATALKNLGYTHEECLNLTPLDLVDGLTEEAFHSVLKITEQSEYIRETVQVRKDGTKYHVETHLQIILTSEGKFYLAIILGIDDRVRAENELQKVNLELHKLNHGLHERVNQEVKLRIKNEKTLFEQKRYADMAYLMAAVAHHWRQPLNAIGLIIQTLYDDAQLQELDDIDTHRDRGLELLTKLSGTIDDFSGYFGPESEPTSFNVISCAKSAMQLVKHEVISQNIDMQVICKCAHKESSSRDFSAQPECDESYLYVFGSKEKLQQVFLNLIYNSKEAIMKHSKCDKNYIHITVTGGGQYLSVAVCDSGGGIPDGIKDQIFTPYFTTKHDMNGTGIGLYMAKTILSQYMNADIDYTNTADGACFTISFNK